VDGSVIAQMSPPDMRTPIQYALTYPHRLDGVTRKLDLTQAFSLQFEPPDHDRFPALGLAYEVARKGGTYGAVLNGANEAAVDAFVKGHITFGQISTVVASTIDAHAGISRPSIEDLFEADLWARRKTRELLGV
jgi:1-deoxy-D-xylulose-5-phosphate reductoisomerase